MPNYRSSYGPDYRRCDSEGRSSRGAADKYFSMGHRTQNVLYYMPLFHIRKEVKLAVIQHIRNVKVPIRKTEYSLNQRMQVFLIGTLL